MLNFGPLLLGLYGPLELNFCKLNLHVLLEFLAN